MKKLKFSISPAMMILLLCMIATTPLKQLSICFAAAAVHELGHILAAKLLSINLSHMKLDVLGAKLGISGMLCSYPAMVALCFAGPFVNLLCFAISFPFFEFSDLLQEFGHASLSLGLLNLIPVQGFDGGRIVNGILSIFLPVTVVEHLCSILGFFSLFCMWMISVWLILRAGTSLTFFVFSCYLFCMLFV